VSAGASVFEVLGLDAVLDNGKRLAILTALESPYAQEEGPNKANSRISNG